MFNIDEIKELMALLENSSLSALEVKQDNVKVRLEKPAVTVAASLPIPPAPATTSTSMPVAPSVPAPAEIGNAIKAPIVGVFYAAPSPDSEPYVSVGKHVKIGDVVCIIEAMKCMNEIQAEEDGEIAAVLVSNGELVEYDQPLFAIK